jgi:hypothetical protein
MIGPLELQINRALFRMEAQSVSRKRSKPRKTRLFARHGACRGVALRNSTFYGRPPSCGSSTCGSRFLITLTLRLQPGDDVLIAAAHTGFAFARFLVQSLT